MKIIGLNNEMLISSACLVNNGKIISAAAEERFVRKKQTKNFPHKAINFCLEHSSLSSNEIDNWVISWNPALYFQKFNPIFSNNRRHLVEQLYSVPDNLMSFFNRSKIDHVTQKFFLKNSEINVNYINHHEAHAANAFYLSNFETAAIMTADSQGELESSTFSIGAEVKLIE